VDHGNPASAEVLILRDFGAVFVASRFFYISLLVKKTVNKIFSKYITIFLFNFSNMRWCQTSSVILKNSPSLPNHFMTSINDSGNTQKKQICFTQSGRE
jgi:hypothetical protein